MFEILYVLDAETELRWIRVVREHTNDAGREREHHIARHFDLTFCFIATAEGNENTHKILTSRTLVTKRAELTENMHARFHEMQRPMGLCR